MAFPPDHCPGVNLEHFPITRLGHIDVLVFPVVKLSN